jgi:isopenicillin N synthase-like dioxygenase
MLVREPRIEGSPRGGSLEILSRATGRWLVVPSPEGELTVQLGSLIEYVTGGRLRCLPYRTQPLTCMLQMLVERMTYGRTCAPWP